MAEPGIPDHWIPRPETLIKLTGQHPFNANPPLSIDEALPHFVRNHGDVPKLDKDHPLIIGDRSFSLDEIRSSFPSIEIPVTLSCCGNRRGEVNVTSRSNGFDWGASVISTSVWKGASLAWILENILGVEFNEDVAGKFFCMEGMDETSKGVYGSSLPLAIAMDRLADIMVAYEKDGQPLPPDHGFPFRMIIPGYVAGKMVKWLKKIYISDKESTSYYHFYDNRLLPPPPIGPANNEEAAAGEWFMKPEFIIYERQINSVTVSPEHDQVINLDNESDTFLIKGYAHSGGGRAIIRVELSFDGGKTFILVSNLKASHPPRHGVRYWTWSTWSHPFPIGSLAQAKEIIVRAWDSAQNTQPSDITWNLLGMMNNAWYRIKIHKEGSTLRFLHPTDIGGKEEGWMNLEKTLEIARTPKIVPDIDFTTAEFTASEISKHNTADSCWIILNKLVYDVTSYLVMHPGGGRSILCKAGQDTTKVFESIHSVHARKISKQFVIGKVVNEVAACQADLCIMDGKVADKIVGTQDNKKAASSCLMDGKAVDKVAVSQANPFIMDNREVIVVVGFGMVGLRFLEKIVEFDVDKIYKLIVFGEELHHAYNRVTLTKYFSKPEIKELELIEIEFYHKNDIQVITNDKVIQIDTVNKKVKAESGMQLAYHHLVLATGSTPFVPPVPGKDLTGVFVYRTVDDLDNIMAYSKGKRNAVVIGGGLLGIEAAKACLDIGLNTTILERSPWLMRRQLDKTGGELLALEISKLGINIMTSAITKQFVSKDGIVVDAVEISCPGDTSKVIDADLIIFSCGIIPRDELARTGTIEKDVIKIGSRGGILVDNHLKTTCEHVYAIGECALYNGMIYGLVAPGYDMAECVASTLCGKPKEFLGATMSTRLKLMGVEVGSFGDYFPSEIMSRPVIFQDNFSGVYKRLLFNVDGTRLLGGILVGDTSQFYHLLQVTKSKKPLDQTPSELIGFGGGASSEANGDMDGDAQVCSCNDASKNAIVQAMQTKGYDSTLDDIKKSTKAGKSNFTARKFPFKGLDSFLVRVRNYRTNMRQKNSRAN